jgi:hypothetical protein
MNKSPEMNKNLLKTPVLAYARAGVFVVRLEKDCIGKAA